MTLRRIPEPLFKYLTCGRAKQILANRTIRFTQPRDLNDPYEMQLIVNPQSVIDDFVSDLVARDVEKARAEDIASRSIENLVFDMVEDVKKERDSLGVLSLSEVNDGLLMWAHYAQDHKGVAIGLKLEACLMPSNPDGDGLVWFDDVKYGAEKVDFIKEKKRVWQTLFYKGDEWRYEKEWRIVRSLKKLKHVVKEIYVAELWNSAIDCVILGARMSSEDEAEILDILKAAPDLGHVKVFKAVVRPDTFGLEIIPIEEWASRVFCSEVQLPAHWREIREWVNLKELADLQLHTETD